MDYSRPGLSVHGLFLARILEWVAISSSKGRDLLDPGFEPSSPVSPALLADLLTLSHHGKPHHSSLSNHKCWAVTSESKVWIFYSNPINCPQNRDRCVSMSQGFSLRYSLWWSFISFPVQSPLSLSLKPPYIWSLVFIWPSSNVPPLWQWAEVQGETEWSEKISLKKWIFEQSLKKESARQKVCQEDILFSL